MINLAFAMRQKQTHSAKLRGGRSGLCNMPATCSPSPAKLTTVVSQNYSLSPTSCLFPVCSLMNISTRNASVVSSYDKESHMADVTTRSGPLQRIAIGAMSFESILLAPHQPTRPTWHRRRKGRAGWGGGADTCKNGDLARVLVICAWYRQNLRVSMRVRNLFYRNDA